MTQDLSFSYAALIKADKQADGTLKVYGKATDDAIDIDQQICDPTWLKKAMPDWFETGGNVREQHSNIAAGVATEYEEKADGHYITALVVDPNSIKKVEAGVLKGFSIGIRGPRVVRDNKAAGGRIVDGQIVEVSLVDRPANPNAKLMLAKAADGGVLEAVKQLDIPTPADLKKYSEDQARDEAGRFSSGGGSSDGATSHDAAGSGAPGVNGNHDTASSTGNVFKDTDKTIMGHADALMEHAMSDKNAYEAVARLGDAQSAINAAEAAPSDVSTPSGLSNQAAGALLQSAGNMLMAASAASSSSNPAVKAEGEKIRNSWENLMPMVNRLTTGKSANVDVVKSDEATEIVDAAKSLLTTLNKFDQATYDRANAALADLIIVEANEMKAGSDELDSIKELLRSAKHLAHWYEGEADEGEVPGVMPDGDDEDAIYMSADADCGCDGGDDCACDKAKMCKCYATSKAATLNVTVDDEQVSSIISKAVETAKASVADEIALLKTALEAESAKAVQLEAELVDAKKAAVAGGPKRAAIQKSTTEINSYLAKAAEYRAKADGTLDRTLAEGYLDLAADFEAKAKKGNA